jgi:hypothetical protein
MGPLLRVDLATAVTLPVLACGATSMHGKPGRCPPVPDRYTNMFTEGGGSFFLNDDMVPKELAAAIDRQNEADEEVVPRRALVWRD